MEAYVHCERMNPSFIESIVSREQAFTENITTNNPLRYSWVSSYRYTCSCSIKHQQVSSVFSDKEDQQLPALINSLTNFWSASKTRVSISLLQSIKIAAQAVVSLKWLTCWSHMSSLHIQMTRYPCHTASLGTSTDMSFYRQIFNRLVALNYKLICSSYST